MRRLLLVLALVLAACGGGADADTSSAPRALAPVEASELLAGGGVTLVDVRTAEEFATGHLAGAMLLDAQAPDFRQQLAPLDRDESFLLYCRSGNRSAAALEVMDDLGFTDVVHLEGGITAWTAAGLPIVR